MVESVCDVLIFCGMILTCYVSGWYVYVGSIDMFGFLEMDLCDLKLCFFCASMLVSMYSGVYVMLFSISVMRPPPPRPLWLLSCRNVV